VTYELSVFDAFGALAWQAPEVPAINGDDVRAPYAGPPLAPGMVYQFRATSFRRSGPLSRTEELRGVFSVR
jgi:hypothetical protein